MEEVWEDVFEELDELSEVVGVMNMMLVVVNICVGHVACRVAYYFTDMTDISV